MPKSAIPTFQVALAVAVACLGFVPAAFAGQGQAESLAVGSNAKLPEISLKLNFQNTNTPAVQDYLKALSQLSLYFVKGSGLWSACPAVEVTRKDTNNQPNQPPFAFLAGGNGLWPETLVLRGCGTEKLFKFSMMMTDGKISHGIMLVPPGTSKSLRLSASDRARTVALAAAKTKLAPCPDAVVTDTDDLEPKVGTPNDAKPWHEVWEMTGCGRPVKIPLLFTPNSTQIDVVAEKAH